MKVSALGITAFFLLPIVAKGATPTLRSKVEEYAAKSPLEFHQKTAEAGRYLKCSYERGSQDSRDVYFSLEVNNFSSVQLTKIDYGSEKRTEKKLVNESASCEFIDDNKTIHCKSKHFKMTVPLLKDPKNSLGARPNWENRPTFTPNTNMAHLYNGKAYTGEYRFQTIGSIEDNFGQSTSKEQNWCQYGEKFTLLSEPLNNQWKIVWKGIPLPEFKGGEFMLFPQIHPSEVRSREYPHGSLSEESIANNKKIAELDSVFKKTIEGLKDVRIHGYTLLHNVYYDKCYFGQLSDKTLAAICFATVYIADPVESPFYFAHNPFPQTQSIAVVIRGDKGRILPEFVNPNIRVRSLGENDRSAAGIPFSISMDEDNPENQLNSVLSVRVYRSQK